MTLSSRAIALEGAGAAPLVFALRGLVSPPVVSIPLPACLVGRISALTVATGVILTTTCLEQVVELSTESLSEWQASTSTDAEISESSISTDDLNAVTAFVVTIRGCKA